jgi:diguanylate cyclase (GGDEF)-like protein/PAS domain S-box-containing protein
MEPDFEQVVRLLRDVVIVTEAQPLDGEGPRVTYVNPAFTRLTGYGSADIVGRSVCVLRGPGTDAAVVARMRAALSRGESVREVLLNYTRDGQPVWMDIAVSPMRDRNGRVAHFLAVERDVSAHKTLERRIHAASGHDALTGLLARREFFERAEAARARSRAEGRDFGLLLMDVDHFRSINATHGHEVGDELLVQVATAVRGAVRPLDFAGRIAGDEFAVAVPEVEPDQAHAIALHVRAAIRRMRLPGLPWLGVTTSIGVACAEHGDDSIAVLLARAERACEESRRAGRNRVSVDRVYGKVIPFRPRRRAEPEALPLDPSLIAE